MRLVLGGTSTTHAVLKDIAGDYMVSVATEYGFAEFDKRYSGRVIHIRFTCESLMEFIAQNSVTEIIDTTHPHAKEITATARKAAENKGIIYTDRVRGISEETYDRMHIFHDYETLVARMREEAYKSIIITTGSKNIDRFKEFADRSYVRVLPFEKSIKACTDAGFHYSRIIAMQGPFSKDFNTALINELQADCIVTKNSGEGSGFAEKVQAASECGIDILVIEPPE